MSKYTKKTKDMITTSTGTMLGYGVTSQIGSIMPAGATGTAISNNIGAGYRIASTGSIIQGAGAVTSSLSTLNPRRSRKKY